MIEFSLESLIRFDDARPAIISVADSGHARILLLCLRAGQILKDHRSTSQVMVFGLRGRAAFFADGVAHEVRPGVCVILEPGHFHRVEASEEAVLLVVMSPHPSREGYPRDQIDRIIFRGGKSE